MHKVCSFLFVLKVLMNLHCNMNNDSVIDKVEIVQFFLEIIQELFVIMKYIDACKLLFFISSSPK